MDEIGLDMASNSSTHDGAIGPGKQLATLENIKTNGETFQQNENRLSEKADVHNILDFVKLRPNDIHKETGLDHTHKSQHGTIAKDRLDLTPHTQSNMTDTGGVESIQNKQALTTKDNTLADDTVSDDNLADDNLADDNLADENIACNLRQTMAWHECHKKVACDFACKNGADCTFPYCNSLGICECVPAFCKTDRMCHFFRIECHGNFTCQDDQCFCG